MDDKEPEFEYTTGMDIADSIGLIVILAMVCFAIFI